MTDSLSKLIEIAKTVQMTESDKEEQRRSLAYGNTAIENRRISRALVDQQAEKLSRERD